MEFIADTFYKKSKPTGEYYIEFGFNTSKTIEIPPPSNNYYQKINEQFRKIFGGAMFIGDPEKAFFTEKQ